MEVDHRLLDRVQPAALATQMLDRHDMAAVKRAEETDAGIDAFVDELASDELADQHGASAAVALGAALLGAAERTVQPQIVEQRLVGTDIGKGDVVAVQQKPEFGANLDPRHASFPYRWNSRRARAAAARDSA